MVNEFEIKEQFVNNYKKQIIGVLAKAVKEAREQLGDNIYIGIWPKGGYRRYFGDSFVFSAGYEHGDIEKKVVDFSTVEHYIDWHVESYVKFLEDLAKRENRVTLKEIAKECEVDATELEAIIKEAKELGIDNIKARSLKSVKA